MRVAKVLNFGNSPFKFNQLGGPVPGASLALSLASSADVYVRPVWVATTPVSDMEVEVPVVSCMPCRVQACCWFRHNSKKLRAADALS